MDERQTDLAQERAFAGNADYLKILDDMRALHLKKAADYGIDTDPLANVRAANEFGVEDWKGVMIRANDKMKRIKAFAKHGRLENESVEDSFMDLAAYSLIALVLYRESLPVKVRTDIPRMEGIGMEDNF